MTRLMIVAAAAMALTAALSFPLAACLDVNTSRAACEALANHP
jgi:hypothetical protein